jgi:hypothetical protein
MCLYRSKYVDVLFPFNICLIAGIVETNFFFIRYSHNKFIYQSSYFYIIKIPEGYETYEIFSRIILFNKQRGRSVRM